MLAAYFRKITIPGNEIEQQIEKIDSELKEARSALIFYENEPGSELMDGRLMELLIESLDVVQSVITLAYMEGKEALILSATKAHTAKIEYYAHLRGWEIE